jgi:hypothetical protein
MAPTTPLPVGIEGLPLPTKNLGILNSDISLDMLIKYIYR